MTVFVDKEWPVKFVLLKLKNQSTRSRRLSTVGFMEMILGDVRSKTSMHILSEFDPETQALLFRNRYNTAFSERVSYFKVIGADHLSYTTDRSEFIGRNRNLKNPQALSRLKLSGQVASGADACAAMQVGFDLLAGQEREIIFQVGNDSNLK